MISNIYERLITHDKQVDNFCVKFKFVENILEQ